MTLLKKIGTVALRVIGIASGLMPMVEQAIPNTPQSQNVADKLVTAFNTVITAEQMFTAASVPDAKTGSLKLAAATPFIAGIVQALPHFVGKKPKDEAAFEQHCKTLTSTIADIMNDYGD